MILSWLAAALLLAQSPGAPLPAWTPGTLDIHQIQTGRGNSTYFIFPDGTTLLVDAGAVPDRPGPQLAPARPDHSRPPGEWIARYIEQFSPKHPATLDYALVTHYHDDHIAGLAAVAARIPIRQLIDRGSLPASPPADYLRLRDSLRHQALQPGRNDQIVSRAPDFEVRNIAAAGEVWTGQGTDTLAVCPPGEKLTENELSLALRIRFGKFRYFTGGDIPGVVLDNLPACHDLETPVARAVGPVDVLLLDHHGWLDTTNSFFLQTLKPRVVVIPAWHATHPDHGVLRRLIAPPGPRDIFTTELLDATRAIFSYMPDPFRSTRGHVVIRVTEGGARYRVFILEDGDEQRNILSVHGPYESGPH